MDWFEILTRLFATHLREEWQRGASRGYQLVEDDLPTLKGKWRITEQIRRPGGTTCSPSPTTSSPPTSL